MGAMDRWNHPHPGERRPTFEERMKRDGLKLCGECGWWSNHVRGGICRECRGVAAAELAEAAKAKP